jgi:putative ABC transport system substrate-binding protein
VITRRSISLAGGISLLAAHRVGRAQPATTVRRAGILGFASQAVGARTREAFKQGMHDLGWLEGKNVEYRVAYAEGDLNRLDALARELIAQKVDVILAGASLPTRAAQRATKAIPIVMAGVGDPVRQGFVASLARPGGNITGIANQGDELLGKQIQILHEVTPGARRMAILLNESNPAGAALYRAAAQSACAALGLAAVWVVASAQAQLPGAVEQLVNQQAEAVAVVADPMYYSERVRLHELLLPTRLPVAYGQPEHVATGGLLSYAPNYVANFRHAAKYVDRILKGAKPADLPVEQPTKFELVVNLRAARALGITIPQSVLLRADEVIE